MGCDIHMYVEYKKELPIKDSKEREEKWISGDYFKPNPFKDVWEDEEKLERMEMYGSIIKKPKQQIIMIFIYIYYLLNICTVLGD